jgi:hypothetical protein
MENLVVLDFEVYPNYTLFAFKRLDNGKVVTIEIIGEDEQLTQDQRKQIATILQTRTTFGFNSNNYDIPILIYALKRKTAKEICELSNYIIHNNTRGREVMQKFNLNLPIKYKHFDIMPTSGQKASLKLLGGRIHSPKLQDLPIEPNTYLTEKEIEITRLYCINDLNTTIDLYNRIKEEIKLREDISKKYSQNLLSKSDAQIAESIIKSELTKVTGKKFYAPKLPENAAFNYEPPSYIKFDSLEISEVFEFICTHSFSIDKKGSIIVPKELTNIKIKDSSYKIGVGGIHSKEKKQTIIPSGDQLLIEKDVASYYPSMILNEKIFPKHLGPAFLKVYKKIVEDRLKAKKEGDKVVNATLKIVINGTFGKLGSKYSILYSPGLMLKVTLTGQLALLMLIERLENRGIKVVSANTDGFVSLLDKDKYSEYESICLDWELETGLILEENRYNALYSRDVNNYLAIKDDSYKGKGIFTLDALSKNPQATITIKAVINYLIDATKTIEATIRNCEDLREFLVVRSVAGGAVYKDQYLGKVVRWIYIKEGDTIYYKKNGNKVAKSDGSYPVMDLNIEVKAEAIDYDRYVQESYDVLKDIGIK